MDGRGQLEVGPPHKQARFAVPAGRRAACQATSQRESRERFAGYRCPTARSSVFHVLTIWVARLFISERVARKIIELHGIYPSQVRAAAS